MTFNMTTRDRLQILLHRILNPLVKFFISIGLTPNGITTIGLILNLGVAIIFIIGAESGARGDYSYIGWGGAMILFAGMLDLLLFGCPSLLLKFLDGFHRTYGFTNG